MGVDKYLWVLGRCNRSLRPNVVSGLRYNLDLVSLASHSILILSSIESNKDKIPLTLLNARSSSYPKTLKLPLQTKLIFNIELHLKIRPGRLKSGDDRVNCQHWLDNKQVFCFDVFIIRPGLNTERNPPWWVIFSLHHQWVQRSNVIVVSDLTWLSTGLLCCLLPPPDPRVTGDDVPLTPSLLSLLGPSVGDAGGGACDVEALAPPLLTLLHGPAVPHWLAPSARAPPCCRDVTSGRAGPSVTSQRPGACRHRGWSLTRPHRGGRPRDKEGEPICAV